MRASRSLFTAVLITALAGCSTVAAPPSPVPITTTATTAEKLTKDEAEAGLRRGMVSEDALAESDFHPVSEVETGTDPLYLVPTCNGVIASNAYVYRWAWSRALTARGSTTQLITSLARYEGIPAKQAVDEVRQLIACGDYEPTDGIVVTVRPAPPIEPVAGVDGQFSYCEERTGGSGICYLVISHQGYASVAEVSGPEWDTCLAMLSELAPVLGEALLRA